jgi:hypothetical protein
LNIKRIGEPLKFIARADGSQTSESTALKPNLLLRGDMTYFRVTWERSLVTTARDAIRLAAGDGLLVITERRRKGCPNPPNVVRIISREWLAWIANRPKDG